jgi:glycosyltransferase involved in cell wall biosynthesis
VIVGAGPLEAELRNAAAGQPGAFAGFQNQSALPACYAAVDALVLPSDGSETWGLVVNEAMACGVPAIVSDAVGCVDDLVRDGESGFAYPCGNVPALARRMQDFVTLTADRRQALVEGARAAVRGHTAHAAAAGVLQALDVVARREVPA